MLWRGKQGWARIWFSKLRKKMFLETDDAKTFESMKILSSWVVSKYAPASQAKFLGGADFALVACAHAHNHVVVTREVAAWGADVKIPNACKEMAVPHMNTFEMLAAEKVRFDLAQDP
jgi:uncharacterized protein DUF4411